MLNNRNMSVQILGLIILVLIVVGCKTQRTIDGHTEIHTKTGTVPATDDGDHCFKEDDNRDLVLTVKAPEIRKDKRVFPFLFDLIKGPVEDKPKVVVSDGIATITYQGHAEDREKKTSQRQPVHLGPGPYVASAAAPQQSMSVKSEDIAGSQPIMFAYPYVTYDKDKSECPAANSQR